MENRIYLRALEPDDYKTSIQWRRDEEIIKMVGGNKYYVSSEREKQWVTNSIFSNDKLVLAICLKENDKYIGNVMMQEIDYINRSCHAPIMIGDKSEWNKGYATEAKLLMLKYIFEERGMERVFGYVLEDNIASIKSAEKSGYKIEGVMRNSIYKEGKFHNQVIVSILREEFDEVYKTYCERFDK